MEDKMVTCGGKILVLEFKCELPLVLVEYELDLHGARRGTPEWTHLDSFGQSLIILRA